MVNAVVSVVGAVPVAGKDTVDKETLPYLVDS